MNFVRKIYNSIIHLSLALKIFYPLSILIFFFLFGKAVAPLQKFNELKQFVSSDTVFTKEYEALRNHPELTKVIREKAYKESLLAMVSDDSISLAVHLSDSSVSLYLKGVRLHTSYSDHLEKARLLEALSNMEYEKLFSQPLKIEKQFATIVKEPIVIRYAPKDTAEAALTAWEPDTLVEKPAFLLLSLEHGINILFEQDITDNFRGKIVRTAFFTKILIKNSARSIARFVTFRKQEYCPTLRLWIPVDELRAIYRALPQQGLITVSI